MEKSGKKVIIISAMLFAIIIILFGAVASTASAHAAAEKFDFEAYADTYQPATGIVAPPTIVFYIDSVYDYSALDADKLPAVAMFSVSAGKIVDVNGNEICSLDAAVRKCNHKVIPAFYLSDEQSKNAVLNYVNEKNLHDAMIFAKSAQLVKDFKEEYPYIQGGVFFDDVVLSDCEQAIAVRDTVNSARGMVAVVSGNADKEGVELLQSMGVTCWSKVKSTRFDIYCALYSGVNGMVMNNYSMPIDIMENFYEPTLIRKVFLSGHRGEGSKPENTIAGAKTAYAFGADYIELDIVRSKDDNLIVMHDDTLKRTTGYDGAIADMTLGEIRQHTVKGEQIPIIEDYLELISERSDLKLLIELKTADLFVPEILAAKIKEYGVESQVIAISFHEDMLEEFSTFLPEISLNALVDGAYNDIGNLCFYSYMQNSSFGPNYKKIDPELLREARVRGIPIYSWTYAAKNVFEEYMLMDNTSLTSDYSGYAKEQFTAINVNTEKHYVVSAPESIEISGTRIYRERLDDTQAIRKTSAAVNLVLNAGVNPKDDLFKISDVASFENSSLRLGIREGYGIYYFTSQWRNSSTRAKYNVMSRPFEVVSGNVNAEIYRKEISEAEYKGESDIDKKKKKCGSFIESNAVGLIGSLVVATVCIMLLLPTRKKRI